MYSMDSGTCDAYSQLPQTASQPWGTHMRARMRQATDAEKIGRLSASISDRGQRQH